MDLLDSSKGKCRTRKHSKEPEITRKKVRKWTKHKREAIKNFFWHAIEPQRSTYANERLDVTHVSRSARLLHAVSIVSEPEDKYKFNSDRIIESISFSDETVSNHVVREGIRESSNTSSARRVQLEGLCLCTGGSGVRNDQPKPNSKPFFLLVKFPTTQRTYSRSTASMR